MVLMILLIFYSILVAVKLAIPLLMTSSDFDMMEIFHESLFLKVSN